MNMLTKVNYAIMNAFFSRPVEEQIFNASPADNEDLAKAAIAAMREPSEGMIKASNLAEGSGNLDTDATNIYQAMIDAALKEE